MKKHNLAFIDVETTGFDPDKHEIIEIGGIIARQVPVPGRGAKLEVIEEFEYKIKPEHLETASPEALRVNSYNDADWLFAISLAEAMKLVQEKTANAMMVGQNVNFDWNFIQAAFKKCGLENKMFFQKLDLIPMAFTKSYHETGLERFNLEALANYFDVKSETFHSALADVRTTFNIYKKVLEIE